MEAAEAKVKGHREWQVRRDAAVRAERIAKKNLLAAHADDGDADRAVLKASGGKASAERVLVGAKAASALAKRLWMEAVARENEAERQVTQCQDELEDAVRQKKNTEVRLCIAEQEVLTFRTARENIDKEAEAGGIDEETARLADLAEKVRKMEELRKIEQEEREEREKKKREAVKEEAERLEKEALERAEAERRGREQAEAMERLAQEQKEREEQARRAAEYNRTVSLERARCLKRDLKFCKNGNLNIWNTQCALQRFVSVSKEFDTLKFQAPAQPLVFENIPWPILDHPHRMALDRVESQAVDKFFAAIKDVMQTEEYVALFKKARNRFHPDRWRSRGILNSVLDENLRGRLEVAGIEVSKQINHLWDKIVQ
ncbi:hypothetical protein BDY19DRAFT_178372 [Irpex rosettiformis]|uniref:Uncharacterized protein n=1 Tax=Irpex rosettiformis TaxID=378272 RepID=A0ACB8U2R0_9APHY|nr:hypothetical protein BDY19DRAFT_178372 [Irpex rosettiformis]